MRLNKISPVSSSERQVVLDVLRGIALSGICLANYGEFSLYTFQTGEVLDAMPTAGIDRVVKFLQYLFIDGKFYSLFSLLFGIGFSIIMSNAVKKGGNGMKIFYRRMIILLFVGFFHLIFLWAGDILILYAAVGLFLPLFRNVSDRKLIAFATVLLLFPVVIDGCVTVFNLNLSAPVIRATRYFHDRAGITDENFPVWLAEKQSYTDILRFNIAGAFIRMQEFIDGNRVFKVLGLFLLGLCIGRNRIYASLNDNRRRLKQFARYGLIIGFPTSLLYAWESTNGHPFGLVIHSVIYAVSVVPLSLAYTSVICLWFMRDRKRKIFNVLASSGRMALTNYIAQSVFGIIIFYGTGFGLGAATGLVYAELIAAGVFLFQILYSYIWLRNFQYGPLEWCWRMLTYGKRLKLLKQTNNR
jgi:uncharacterized protein